MNIHEYQAKSLFAQFGIPILPGMIAYTPTEALEAAQLIKEQGIAKGYTFNEQDPQWVVKAQIHATGRRKNNGIIMCYTLENVYQAAQDLIGHFLVTPQTSKEGVEVSKVYIEAALPPLQEYSLSLCVNRKRENYSLQVYLIEGKDSVGKKENNSLIIDIDPCINLQSFHVRQVHRYLGMESLLYPSLKKILEDMFRLYKKYDATRIDISSLALINPQDLVVLGGRISFDKNALYRNPEIENLYDRTFNRESKFNKMSYTKLDGNIGCLANGAGLAMATVDMVKNVGGRPANFLDIGEIADEIKIKTALQMLMSNPSIEGIWINIVGGVLRCDTVAKALISATRHLIFSMPIIVRFQGKKHQEGKEILSQSFLPFILCDDLEGAARYVVQKVMEET